MGVLAICTMAEQSHKPEPQRTETINVARGQELFLENCAICHGVRGDGHGIRSEGLYPRPPDFTNAEWQVTHPEQSVTNSIREGVHGTAMPSWRILGEQRIRDLSAFVKSR